jgi:cupin superfamily acireductone dioxygenase involved in methionine salvage
MILSQKEKMYLEDLKTHEEVCIKKYNEYSNRAQDSQLKQIFKNHETKEQEHLNTINQIMSGTVPNVNQGQSQNQSQKEKTENIKKAEKVMKAVIKEQEFKIGDCVYISSLGRTGIVCELENNKGEVGVMFMKKKIKVNKKRLSLYIDSKELYPEQYDMDIVLESKENRKKKHTMNRKHVDGLTIEYGDEFQ